LSRFLEGTHRSKAEQTRKVRLQEANRAPSGGFTILASEVNAGLFFSSSIRLRVVNKRRKSAVTTNQALAAASAVFAWAMRRDLLAVNPCAKVDRNPTKSRDRVLLRVRVPMRKSVGLSSPEMIGA
jgi:hypothetical protein